MIDGCVRLVAGADVDADLLLALGGPGARKFLDGRPHADRYWLRVWGLRGLLWAWDDRACAYVRSALTDESLRVREMALKVVAKRAIGEAMAGAARLRTDPVPRVRSAAERAVRLLTQAGA